VVVLLLQPETGDDLQWEKAGVLEVADVVVIHKADLPGAEQALAQVRAALDLSGTGNVPVLRVSARTGEGIDALWQAIVAGPGGRQGGGAEADELLRLAQKELAARFARAGGDERLRRLLEAWQQGGLSAADAAAAVLDLLSGGPR